MPLLVSARHAHETVRSWAAGRTLGLTGHTLAETYSVLTRLPGDSRLSATDAVVLIDDNFAEHYALSIDGARAAHRDLARLGVAGGAIYDCLVALAAGPVEGANPGRSGSIGCIT